VKTFTIRTTRKGRTSVLRVSRHIFDYRFDRLLNTAYALYGRALITEQTRAGKLRGYVFSGVTIRWSMGR